MAASQNSVEFDNSYFPQLVVLRVGSCVSWLLCGLDVQNRYSNFLQVLSSTDGEIREDVQRINYNVNPPISAPLDDTKSEDTTKYDTTQYYIFFCILRYDTSIY